MYSLELKRIFAILHLLKTARNAMASAPYSGGSSH